MCAHKNADCVRVQQIILTELLDDYTGGGNMQLTNPSRNGDEGIPYRMKIGELLMQEKLLTAAQLEQALANQRNHQAFLPLEEICVELGFLSRTDLSKAFRKVQNSLHLGELLG